jgi:hypothetical protein
MKRANKVIASILFTAFVVIILLWTASLTFQLVSRILPNDPITPWFALMLFDGGALTWLYVWKNKAQGAGQRGISMLMMVIDLIGVIIMAGGEIAMAQQFFAVNELGQYLVYALIGWTLLNVAAVYGYHTQDPETIRDAEVKDVQDEVQDESLKMLRSNMQSISANVASALSYQTTVQALRDLLPAGTEPEIIEAYARPVKHQAPQLQAKPQQQLPTPPTYSSRQAQTRRHRVYGPAPKSTAQVYNSETEIPDQLFSSMEMSSDPTQPGSSRVNGKGG